MRHSRRDGTSKHLQLAGPVAAVSVEERVDLRSLHAAEDERLSVELGPAVEVEHAYVADVGSVRLSRHRVQILQQKLQQSASVKLASV